MTRKLIRWKDYHDCLIALHLQSWLNENGYSVDWPAIAARIEPDLSGSAVVQHLAKQRNRFAEQNLRVPDPLKRGNKKTGIFTHTPINCINEPISTDSQRNNTLSPPPTTRAAATHNIVRYKHMSSASYRITKPSKFSQRRKRDSGYDSDKSYMPNQSSQPKGGRRTPRASSIHSQQSTSEYYSEESDNATVSDSDSEKEVRAGRTSPVAIPEYKIQDVTKMVVLQVPSRVLKEFPCGIHGRMAIAGKRLGPRTDSVQATQTGAARQNLMSLRIDPMTIGTDASMNPEYMSSTMIMPSPYTPTTMHHSMPNIFQHSQQYGQYNNGYINMPVPSGFPLLHTAEMTFPNNNLSVDPAMIQRLLGSQFASQAHTATPFDTQAREFANQALHSRMSLAENEYNTITDTEEAARGNLAASDFEARPKLEGSSAAANMMREKTPVLVPSSPSPKQRDSAIVLTNSAALSDEMLTSPPVQGAESADGMDLDHHHSRLTSEAVAGHDGTNSPIHLFQHSLDHDSKSSSSLSPDPLEMEHIFELLVAHQEQQLQDLGEGLHNNDINNNSYEQDTLQLDGVAEPHWYF